jgi:hypothetical protein
VTAAAFDNRVNDCAPFASLGVTKEQPILFSQCGGSDRILNQVVADFYCGVFEMDFQ